MTLISWEHTWWCQPGNLSMFNQEEIVWVKLSLFPTVTQELSVRLHKNTAAVTKHLWTEAKAPRSQQVPVPQWRLWATRSAADADARLLLELWKALKAGCQSFWQTSLLQRKPAVCCHSRLWTGFSLPLRAMVQHYISLSAPTNIITRSVLWESTPLTSKTMSVFELITPSILVTFSFISASVHSTFIIIMMMMMIIINIWPGCPTESLGDLTNVTLQTHNISYMTDNVIYTTHLQHETLVTSQETHPHPLHCVPAFSFSSRPTNISALLIKRTILSERLCIWNKTWRRRRY